MSFVRLNEEVAGSTENQEFWKSEELQTAERWNEEVHNTKKQSRQAEGIENDATLE